MISCTPNKRTILLIVLNSALLATGVLLIVFSCALYHNWWPLFMVFVFIASCIFPLMCNACKMEDPNEFMDSNRDEIGPMLGWFMVGLFLVLGYSIPIELVRKGLFHLTGFWMATGGGTVMLMAIVLFIKILFY